MPSYADSFDPPAPVALVVVRNLLTGQEVSKVPMLLDTGADSTLLPLEAVKALAIPIDRTTTIKLTAFDGTPSESGTAEAALRLEGFTFRGHYILIDAPIGIVGRDILNLLMLTLDGTRLTWNLENPRVKN